jgi:hypothetical protein
MNPLDRLLQDELNRLLDRIAASTGEGAVSEGLRGRPELRVRIEQVESRLAGLRADMLERYAEWTRALEECEGLWALVALQGEGTLRAA